MWYVSTRPQRNTAWYTAIFHRRWGVTTNMYIARLLVLHAVCVYDNLWKGLKPYSFFVGLLYTKRVGCCWKGASLRYGLYLVRSIPDDCLNPVKAVCHILYGTRPHQWPCVVANTRCVPVPRSSCVVQYSIVKRALYRIVGLYFDRFLSRKFPQERWTSTNGGALPTVYNTFLAKTLHPWGYIRQRYVRMPVYARPWWYVPVCHLSYDMFIPYGYYHRITLPGYTVYV